MKSLEVYHFIEECKKFHLTKNDVEKLRPGDKIDVVIWDGNFEEYWIWEQPPGESYLPEVFFSENRHQIVYLGDQTWTIEFNFGENINHPLHLYVESLGWRSLGNGKKHDCGVPNSGPYSWIIFEPEETKKHYDEFPPETRVGWRGPIMLWENLLKIKYKVHHEMML